MPWECLSCSSEYTDDLLQCDNASCASPQSKAAWTLHDNATRTFVLKAAQLEVSRGVAAEPSPAANWTLEGQELVETSVARALPKSSVLELFRATRVKGFRTPTMNEGRFFDQSYWERAVDEANRGNPNFNLWREPFGNERWECCNGYHV